MIYKDINLIHRLRDLFLISIEEYPENSVISSNSLETFIDFIIGYKIKYESLVLTFDGNLRGEWKSQYGTIKIEFKNKNLLSVIFRFDNKQTLIRIVTLEDFGKLANEYDLFILFNGRRDWSED